MAVGAVHVAVGDFLFGSAAHIDHLAAEAQVLPGQRVVAIQVHFRAFDLHDRERAGIALGVPALELPPKLHPRRELRFGDDLLQSRVEYAKGIFGAKVYRDLVTGRLPFQRSLDFGKNIAIAPVQISQGLLALFQHFALHIGQLEMDGDGTVFGDKHEKPPVFEAPIIRTGGGFPDNCGILSTSPRRSTPMSDTQQRIASLVQSNDVVLFMKGTASFPQCGFSGRAIQILKGCGLDGKTIATVNVLEDPEVRQGIKEFSNWPTIPQLYVKGEFIGGSDIMTEMYETGELQKIIAG